MENDASLSGNSVAHGLVDSTLGWLLPKLKSEEPTRVHYWIVLGKKYCNVLKVDFCDSDIIQFGAGLYSYCWPRDAIWICLALDTR
jgi:GH15 family glucan-1,4-alpha-glucosidase